MHLGKEHIAQNSASLSGHTQHFCQSRSKLRLIISYYHCFKVELTIKFTWLWALLCATPDDRYPSRKCNKMRSVWMACFQFWGKQHLLHIDVLFLRYILIVQQRIEWVQLDRLKKKALKCNDTSSSHFVCQAAWWTPKIRMQRFAFECEFLFLIWRIFEIQALLKTNNNCL